MANLARVRVSWSGAPVIGSGVSTFYFDEAASGFSAAVRTFFSSLAGRIPAGVSILVQNSGDLIDVSSGALSGTWTDPNTGGITSSGTGNYAAGVGARVKWLTAGIRNGRRVTGSTFIVPLHLTAYDSSGTILNTVLGEIENAAQALLTATGTDMKVYSRPVGGGGGAAHSVVSRQVPDMVSWLRSRRT